MELYALKIKDLTVDYSTAPEHNGGYQPYVAGDPFARINDERVIGYGVFDNINYVDALHQLTKVEKFTLESFIEFAEKQPGESLLVTIKNIYFYSEGELKVTKMSDGLSFTKGDIE